MSMVNALPKQNQQYHIVLLAGGPRDIARELRDKIAKKRDILVKYHLEYDKEHQWDKPIPADVDFVIMLKDMMSHSQFYKIKEACQKAGIRWIVTQRKLAILINALANHGLRASEGVPLNVATTTIFQEDNTPPKDWVARTAENYPPLKVVEPPPPEELKPESAPVEPAKVSVFVSQVPVPQGAAPTPRKGCPRPETMVLIATLYQMAQDDGINIMITPTSINTEPAK